MEFEETGFDPAQLTRSVIAPPLQRLLAVDPAPRIVIDLNLAYEDGLGAARRRVAELVERAAERLGTEAPPPRPLSESSQYLAARLPSPVVREVARLDREAAGAHPEHRAIHRMWPDFKVRALTDKSVATVKADAALRAFAADGTGVVWAVLDSGIDGTHPHFRTHRTLRVEEPLEHKDFVTGKDELALTDPCGHGTHVAGIIAGEQVGTSRRPLVAVREELDEKGDLTPVRAKVARMAGMAPRATLLSYRILDEEGSGDTSTIITALDHIQQLNGYGRNLVVHGVNLSVGYPFDPEWFACGQSPLCVEVDRLVRSGVVVVAAAGNTGYGFTQLRSGEANAGGLGITVNDPGNADLAITVGSTHRDMPHRYGVSFFSSKGPTGDGRAKPDLVAPGERILSSASGTLAARAQETVPAVQYVEDSGTSMAAPHVSGCIAAFLSIRREFLGRPEEVKDLFLRSATDLGRVPEFQGRGLVDLMRAIQLV
jgi:subtilisin family serine protease